jgi:hypothetical protein
VFCSQGDRNFHSPTPGPALQHGLPLDGTRTAGAVFLTQRDAPSSPGRLPASVCHRPAAAVDDPAERPEFDTMTGNTSPEGGNAMTDWTRDELGPSFIALYAAAMANASERLAAVPRR